MTRKTLKYTTWCAIGLMFVVFFIVLYNFNPTETNIYPRCPSKALTGYDCPGCGSLRGMHALIHGKWAEAWNFNPAIFFAIPLIALCIFAGLHRNTFLYKYLPKKVLNLSKRTAKFTDRPSFPVILLIAVILWTIIRNL